MSIRQSISLVAAVVLASMMSCKNEGAGVESGTWSVLSPGKKLHVTVTAENGKLFYSAVLKPSNAVVLEKSPLGLTLQGADFNDSLVVQRIDSSDVKVAYTLQTGKKLVNEAEARVLAIQFTNSRETAMVHFNVFDDGFAFRYVVENGSSEYTVVKEETGFKLPEGSDAWLQEYDSVTRYTPAYERYFEDKIPAGTASAIGNGWCFPALFHSAGAWVLLSESDLSEKYFGSHLMNEPNSTLYVIQQPDPKEAESIGDIEATGTFPLRTPWRVVIASENLAEIFESNLITHVASEPQEGMDYSWVKPGRAAWSWWSEMNSPRNFGVLKNFVDFTAEMKWEYFLVDANWNEMKGGSIEDLVEYASKKNVGIWLWYNSGGKHNTVTEQPRDIMADPEQRKAEFRKIAGWGVKGVKVDFFQSDKQWMIKHYLDILRDAAENHIMVNFHGCTIPRGWNKTYPHMLSMESVRGAESYIFARDFPKRAPLLNVHLAFTRNVIGPMDYTPVTLSNNRFPHLTTSGHEMALSVVFETGIIHYADHYKTYKSLTPDVKAFMSELPVTWIQTRLLSGDPSSHVVVARETDNAWYIAGINGQDKELELSLDLSFLGSGNHEAFVITDKPGSKDLLTSKKSIRASQKEAITLLPFGGFVMRVSKGG
jgi:alpha-glucosidase